MTVAGVLVLAVLHCINPSAIVIDGPLLVTGVIELVARL